MAAVLADYMDRLLEWQLVLQLQIRDIESRHKRIHEELIDWGRWGRGWDQDKPRLAPAGIWSLPGDHDPDLDPDAVPESPAPPINERRVKELDIKIGDTNFPAIWRKVLTINYVGARARAGFYVIVPEWQRPKEARVDPENYRVQLGLALRHLGA